MLTEHVAFRQCKVALRMAKMSMMSMMSMMAMMVMALWLQPSPAFALSPTSAPHLRGLQSLSSARMLQEAIPVITLNLDILSSPSLSVSRITHRSVSRSVFPSARHDAVSAEDDSMGHVLLLLLLLFPAKPSSSVIIVAVVVVVFIAHSVCV